MSANEDFSKDSLTFKTDEFIEGVKADVRRMLKEASQVTPGFHVVILNYGETEEEGLKRYGLESDDMENKLFVVFVKHFGDPNAPEPEPKVAPWQQPFEVDPVIEDLMPENDPESFVDALADAGRQIQEQEHYDPADVTCGIIDDDPEILAYVNRKGNKKITRLDDFKRTRRPGPWGWMA